MAAPQTHHSADRRAGVGIVDGGTTRVEGATVPGTGPLLTEGRQHEGLDGRPVDLRRGDCGLAVHAWQVRLSQAGYLDDASGTYDDLTELATRVWQEAHDLEPTGVVGPAEREAAESEGAT